MQPHHHRHGLTLQVQYFYGGLRDADGVMWALERKFIGPMTGGLWFMNDSTGDLNLHPGAFTSSRGESIRTIEPSRRVWRNHLMHTMSEKSGVTSEPLEVIIDDGRISGRKGNCSMWRGR